MHRSDEALAAWAFGQMRLLIRSLGENGGLMTPSIYETAQVLRFCPEYVEVDNVIDWLLRRQQPDGSWGERSSPLYSDAPTLAVLLALRAYRRHVPVREAVGAAERYLRRQETPVLPADGEYLPVGVELVLPSLLDGAEESGLATNRERFAYVEQLGAERRALLAKHPPAPNSPAMFSWEAWGQIPDPELVGPAGVGHNPAATAWWLHLDRTAPDSAARQRAIRAIRLASHATQSGIVGVVPDAWPMDRFEQSLVLHLLSTVGLLTDSRLAGAVEPQLQGMASALRPSGLGFSDDFEADGDDTAAAVAALAAAGMPVDVSVLSRFERPDRCVSYPFELHGSHTVTARAMQALRLTGCEMTAWRPYILRARRPDGWWTGDKWNRSRLYGSWIALAGLGEAAGEARPTAAQAYLRNQHADGGWGCFGRSTLSETAFGLLALAGIVEGCGCEDECRKAIDAAHHYLRQGYNVHRIGEERMWICKDLYSARRIDQGAILAALLAPYLRPELGPRLRRRLHTATREAVAA